jgi:phosphoenolpyruvate carboxylase
MAVIGALVSNVIVAAAFTAQALETSTLTILRAVTSMTWPVFFDEAISAADVVFALFGAAIAAYYANRRLTRAEFLALRKWQKGDIDV